MILILILSLMLNLSEINVDLDINEAFIPLLTDETRERHVFGGSSSGKSYFEIGQNMLLDLLAGERNYLCLRNVARTLRESIYNEAIQGIDRLKEQGLKNVFKVNQTDMTITCINGYQAILKGLDDVDKVKSIKPKKGVITDILIEEATEVRNKDIIKQLKRRLRGKVGPPKRITYLYNPMFKTHWMFKDAFAGRWSDSDTFYKDEKLLILKTTYKDNIDNLSQEDIDELENETDPYWFEVYTLGNWGVLGELVFTKWRIEDLGYEIPVAGGNKALYKNNFGIYHNGLDFGYSNDPTAGIRTAIKGKSIYITHELMYDLELTNDVIANRLRPQIGTDVIRCDSSEPKSIAELRQHDINAIGAIKGPGSVNYGIQYLKQHELIVDKECQNFINEISIYQWEKDKDGNVLNKPVDRDNHLIDATRYAHDSLMRVEPVKAYTKDELGLF